MKRRTFIKNTIGASTMIGTIGYGAWSCSRPEKTVSDNEKEEKSLPIGIQLYSLATILSEDFEGTLKMLAETGYKKLEFAGPYYFSPQEEIDNSMMIQQMGLKGYGYYGYSPSELKQRLDDLGMSAPSAHISLQSIEHDFDEVLHAAKIIGHEYITIPMMVKPNLDEWKSTADKLNEIGSACKANGIGFAYHNHSQEFGKFEDQVVMDLLMARTESENVKFELDAFWATVAGVDPGEYFEKYPGRFKMIHIKDMAQPMESPNTDWQVFTNPEKAMEIISNQTVIGEGVIDYRHVIEDARKAGIEHYFIESDFPADPVMFAQKSYDNLTKIISG